MGMMNKMRDNTHLVLYFLIFAFGVIWVLQDSGGLDVIGAQGTTVGTVNGDDISFEEYSQAVDVQVQRYQSRTGNTMSVQQLDRTRDQIFNQLVDDRLRQQEMDRIGLEVADEEIIEMVRGENPDPIIVSYFGDGQGNIDRTLMDNFIENPDTRLQWIQIEAYLRAEKRRSKLAELIMGTVRVSSGDVDFEYEQRNKTVNVSFAAARFSSITDDEISYTDRDLRAYYNELKDEFKRNRSYSISYVGITKDATSSDSAIVFSDLEELRSAFMTTDEDSLFLLRNGSERPYVDVYFKPNELDAVLSDAIFADATPGTIVGPIVSNNEAHLIKIIDVREPEEPSVEARHILFSVSEDDADSDSEALAEARSILADLRGGADFAEQARLHSDDSGSGARGGALGWFGPGRMVSEFEDAAFDAEIGRVVGPIKTEFGYHLIEVISRATVEAKIGDFALSLEASVSTLNKVQEELDDLLYFSEEEGDFEEEAGRRSLAVNTVQIEEDQLFIPGIGNSRSLANFLETAGVGDLSPVIELDDKFIVAVVTKVQKEGYRSFDEVRTLLEPRLRNELKGELLVERMESAETGSLDAAATAVGTTVQTVENLSFSNMIIAGIGRDPMFVGTAMGVSEGAVSNVITGSSAVYMLRVDAISNPDEATNTQREQIYSQLLIRRQNTLRSQWIVALRDAADIVDNRRLFLQ